MTANTSKFVLKLSAKMIEIIIENADETLTGKCQVCNGPLDIDGICIDIDCSEYNKEN